MRNSFVSTVLLSRAEWDPERLLADLGENWDIRLTDVKFKDNVMAASYGSDMISVSMISSPVPDGEAEYYARYWPGHAGSGERGTETCGSSTDCGCVR